MLSLKAVTRVFASLHRSIHTHRSERIRHDLRSLLRETAQPVAVVTSLMPGHHTHDSENDTNHLRYHGATLSSFSSIAMDPHPLVAFSLRIPSRMATSLKDAHNDWPTHMVVNILSASQKDVAIQFSRPDLHPHPFESVAYELTEEGLPILKGSLGALSCKLAASSWPLHDLELLRHGRREEDAIWEGEGVASELFIARVTRVEDVGDPEGDDQSARTPLLYHRRAYATTCHIPPAPSPSRNKT